MLKPLIKAEIVQNILSNVDLDESTKDEIIQSNLEKFDIFDEEKRNEFLSKNNLSWDAFQNAALRDSRLEKYCKKNFDHKVESYFLERKSSLDIVIYSLIRTKDIFLAKELYLRVLENEEDFGELATKYSEGIEKKTRGIIGPVPLNQSHPQLATILKSISPGRVNPPIELQNYHLVIRLESFDSAELDDLMRKKISQELFNKWADSESDNLLESLLTKHKKTPVNLK